MGLEYYHFLHIPNSNFAASGISIDVTLPYSYIAINFFAIPIAFKKYSEQKSENISYLMYLLVMSLIIPIVAVLITLAVLLIFKIKLTALDYFEPVFNYGFLGLSIIFLIANFFIHYKKVN